MFPDTFQLSEIFNSSTTTNSGRYYPTCLVSENWYKIIRVAIISKFLSSSFHYVMFTQEGYSNLFNLRLYEISPEYIFAQMKKYNDKIKTKERTFDRDNKLSPLLRFTEHTIKREADFEIDLSLNKANPVRWRYRFMHKGMRTGKVAYVQQRRRNRFKKISTKAAVLLSALNIEGPILDEKFCRKLHWV